MLDLKFGKRKVINYRGANRVVGGLTSKNKIDILLYISKELAKADDEKELFNRVLSLSSEIFEPDNSTLRVLSDDMLKPVAFLHETVPPRRSIQSNEGFSGSVFISKKPDLFDDLSYEADLIDSGETTRCVMCVPVFGILAEQNVNKADDQREERSQVIGTLSIESETPYFYHQEDLDILEAMAAQIGMALTEVKLVDGLRETRAKLQSDMKMGRDVQAQIVQDEIHPWHGLYFKKFYEPMVEVSGDYFDVYRNDEHVTILIADVSGHGVPAALITMIIHYQFRELAKNNFNLDELMNRLSNKVNPKLPEGVYFTAQLVRIRSTGDFEFSNAGHIKLAWWQSQSQQFKMLDTRGLPLGIIDQQVEDFEVIKDTLSYGDFLIFATDGFSEQKMAGGEEYGSERVSALWTELIQSINYGEDPNAAKLADQFISTWKERTEFKTPDDDLTLLVVEFFAGAQKAIELGDKAKEAIQNRELGTAYKLINSAVLHDISFPDNWYLKARLDVIHKDQDSAYEALEKIRKINATWPKKARILYAKLLFHKGMYEESIYHLNKIRRQGVKDPSITAILMKCYQKTKSYDNVTVLRDEIKGLPEYESLTKKYKLQKLVGV